MIVNKLYVLIGLPGSSKSTWAKNKQKEDGDIIILSSDEIRKEIFDDENCQSDNNKVFGILHQRLKDKLIEGKDVIFDATNISYKPRQHLLNQTLKDVKCEKIAVYFNTPFEVCEYRNAQRERKVPDEVIKRMYRHLNIPTFNEGFDGVLIVDDLKEREKRNFILPKNFEEYKSMLYDYGLGDCVDYDQNNKFHNFTLDKHMFTVYELLKDSLGEKDEILISALLHDIGKTFCRSDSENGSHYYGHEFVSAQRALDFLLNFNIPLNQILDICIIIENHMRLYFVENEKQIGKFIKRVGFKNSASITLFNIADRFGH